MAEKLGMSTGKGYHSGIYNGYATEASRLQSIVITSYEDLMSYIPQYPNANYNTYAVSINERPITFPDGTVIHPWCSGMLIVEADASLILTCSDGSIISAYHNNVANTWNVQTFTKTKNCLWKCNPPYPYVAPLPSAENVFTSNTEKALDLSQYVNELVGKRLIIEICKYSIITNVSLPDKNLCSFLTNPFSIINEAEDNNFQQNINGENFWFRTSGTTLYFNSDYTPETSTNSYTAYYIKAIYEED